MKTSAIEKNHITARRVAHHKAMESLVRGAPKTGQGHKMWQALRKAEGIAHRAAEQYCNGEIGEMEWESVVSDVTRRVVKQLGCVPDGFTVNADPRGYALKIRGRDASYEGGFIPVGMETDWGGNGILAPEIN